MRLVDCLLAVSGACAALEASIHLLDSLPSQSKQQPRTIAPSTARLLVAQRLGLSQYHDLGDADEDTLDILNSFRGEELPIFDDDATTRPSIIDKALYVVEGVEDVQGDYV